MISAGWAVAPTCYHIGAPSEPDVRVVLPCATSCRTAVHPVSHCDLLSVKGHPGSSRRCRWLGLDLLRAADEGAFVDVTEPASSLSLAMVLTTILTTIRVRPPKSAK